MSRCPTEKQYAALRVLASGNAGLSWRKRDTAPLVRHGWVTAELDGSCYQWVRITANGLRALAKTAPDGSAPESTAKKSGAERGG